MDAVVYWDTSAILSALFRDEHSDTAIEVARDSGTHLISSLAWTEAHAVIARIERERKLAHVLVEAAREALQQGPWRRANVAPEWNGVQTLAKAWPLRGAALWNLAAAKTLRNDLPELTLLSFDARLASAAAGEGFAHVISRGKSI